MQNKNKIILKLDQFLFFSLELNKNIVWDKSDKYKFTL